MAQGPNADCSALSEYIQKNMVLYAFNNEQALGTHAAANFIRGEVGGRTAHGALRGWRDEAPRLT